MSHHEDKKDKKKALLKKNRKTQEIFNAFRLMRNENERVRDLEEDKREAAVSSSPGSGDKEVWSAKVATIRNRLDGRKRDSKERWNRFAGTGGEGGRGL